MNLSDKLGCFFSRFLLNMDFLSSISVGNFRLIAIVQSTAILNIPIATT